MSYGRNALWTPLFYLLRWDRQAVETATGKYMRGTMMCTTASVSIFQLSIGTALSAYSIFGSTVSLWHVPWGRPDQYFTYVLVSVLTPCTLNCWVKMTFCKFRTIRKCWMGTCRSIIPFNASALQHRPATHVLVYRPIDPPLIYYDSTYHQPPTLYPTKIISVGAHWDT